MILMLTGTEKLSGAVVVWSTVVRHLLVPYRLASSLKEEHRKAQRCKAMLCLEIQTGPFLLNRSQRRAEGSSSK